MDQPSSVVDGLADDDVVAVDVDVGVAVDVDVGPLVDVEPLHVDVVLSTANPQTGRGARGSAATEVGRELGGASASDSSTHRIASIAAHVWARVSV